MGVAVSLSAADPPITSEHAKDYIGKRVTVCGKVVSIGHVLVKRQGGKQTFLHFDQPPPQSPFMVVIIGGDQFSGGLFYGIEKKVDQKNVCATGYVKKHDEAAMMVVDAPNQLKVMDDAKQ
jgi:hypothetical protein